MRQVINRRHGSFSNLGFKVDLSKYGKTGADISDIFFSVKDNVEDDDNTLLLKTYSGSGGITFSGDEIVTVSVAWGSAEYTNMDVGSDLQAGLFLQFTGDPKADQNVNQIFDLKITQPFLKDN